MKRILMLLAAGFVTLAFAGCGAINAYTGAAINAGEASAAGAIQNVKAIDDAKYAAWVQSACALPIGALQRNNTGNSQANKAVMTACPIAGMAIVDTSTGSISVSTIPVMTAPTLTPGYIAPVVAPAAVFK